MSTLEDQIDLINLQQSKGQTLLVPVTLHSKHAQHNIKALLDSGASGEFIDPSLVTKYNLPKFELSKVIKTFNADKSENASGTCTHYTKLKVEINDQVMTIMPKIVSLGLHPLFLGITWLKCYNPDVNWQKPSLHWRNEMSTEILLTHVPHSNCINNLYTRYEINAKQNTSQNLFNATPQKKPKSDPVKVVPKKFYAYLSVFSKEESEKMPPQRLWDHKIEVVPDFKPKQMPTYNLTPQEQPELNKFISKNL